MQRVRKNWKVECHDAPTKRHHDETRHGWLQWAKQHRLRLNVVGTELESSSCASGAGQLPPVTREAEAYCAHLQVPENQVASQEDTDQSCAWVHNTEPFLARLFTILARDTAHWQHIDVDPNGYTLALFALRWCLLSPGCWRRVPPVQYWAHNIIPYNYGLTKRKCFRGTPGQCRWDCEKAVQSCDRKVVSYYYHTCRKALS